MLTYKNYTAKIKVDTEAGVFHGRVLGIKDIITFEGETPKETRQEFYKSIDNYLQFCEFIGQKPDQPVINNKRPPAVQVFIKKPDFINQLVTAVQPFWEGQQPEIIIHLNELVEVLTTLESIKPYLIQKPYAIVYVVQNLNSVLENREASYFNKSAFVDNLIEEVRPFWKEKKSEIVIHFNKLVELLITLELIKSYLVKKTNAIVYVAANLNSLLESRETGCLGEHALINEMPDSFLDSQKIVNIEQFMFKKREK